MAKYSHVNRALKSTSRLASPGTLPRTPPIAPNLAEADDEEASDEEASDEEAGDEDEEVGNDGGDDNAGNKEAGGEEIGNAVAESGVGEEVVPGLPPREPAHVGDPPNPQATQKDITQVLSGRVTRRQARQQPNAMTFFMLGDDGRAQTNVALPGRPLTRNCRHRPVAVIIHSNKVVAKKVETGTRKAKNAPPPSPSSASSKTTSTAESEAKRVSSAKAIAGSSRKPGAKRVSSTKARAGSSTKSGAKRMSSAKAIAGSSTKSFTKSATTRGATSTSSSKRTKKVVQ